ncbi:hypothetical protein OIV83_005482 [Microbotryomycetes sp. JL201]|nr:hypothetical protein OIV83_005482 [Microbotryomycetes sp. JL201]
MSGRIPVGRAALLVGGITALGYGIMYSSVTTYKQFYDSLSPDLKKRVDEQRAASQKLQQQRQQIQQIKDSADQDAPVWSDSLGSSNKR